MRWLADPCSRRNRCQDADTNVGLFGSPRRRRPRNSLQCGLARSVLRLLTIALPLGSIMPLLSGCVLPLSPEFQDPPTQQNYAPDIVSASPLQGSVVSTLTFEITVTDPNVSDTLWIRWIGEYPPVSSDSRLLAPDIAVPPFNGQAPFSSQSITIDCLSSPLAKLPQHPIMALVSDRPFLPRDSDAGLETLLIGSSSPVAKTAEAHWVLNLTCP
jgi:hypothetical protein